MQRIRSTRAFTLIELIVVVIIIGVLAAIAAVAYNAFIASARSTSATASALQASKVLAADSAQTDSDPTSAANITQANGNLNGAVVSAGTASSGTTAPTLRVTAGTRVVCLTYPALTAAGAAVPAGTQGTLGGVQLASGTITGC
jgi:prepilin-type N-terminal cleavage/methylation domain-containing protein